MTARELIVLFRGVSRKNPEFADALRGIVRRPFDQATRTTFLRQREAARDPIKQDTTKMALSLIETAEWHNNRSFFDKPSASQRVFLSSWTRSLETALRFAERDGVVLRAALGPPINPLVWSPDEYNEQEVLIVGDVEGATVMLSEDLRLSPSFPFPQ